MNILYNIAGYIITSTAKCTKICSDCLDSAGSKQYYPNKKYTKFVILRCFRTNTLFFVNDETFNYFLEMETIIRTYLSYLKNTNYNFFNFYFDKMKNINCDAIKDCHNLQLKIMKRFILYRMRISCTKANFTNKNYNSKTMAMHTFVR